jgi:hypothetical protein
MDNKDKTLNAVEQKLLEAKSRLILERIIKAVEEKDGKTIHIEFALEKFENYVNRFDLNASKIELDYLKDMRVKMHDNNGLAPKHIIPKTEKPEPSVTFVDFKNKRIIKPKI